MTAERLGGWPTWLRNLDSSIVISPQILLYGNVRDSHLVPVADGDPLMSTLEAVEALLLRSGFEGLLVWDIVDGLRLRPNTPELRGVVSELSGVELDSPPVPLVLSRLETVMRAVAGCRSHRLGLVIDYASRLTDDPEHPADDLRRLFAAAEKLSRDTFPTPATTDDRSGALYNVVLWIANELRDLPAWLVSQSLATISIPKPDLDSRYRAAEILGQGFDDMTHPSSDAEQKVAEFAAGTDGLTLDDMVDIARLARDQSLTFAEMPDAIRAFKVGILDNPWRREHLREKVARGEASIRRRVLGQGQAVTRTLDILKRSVMGLSGAHASSKSTRPRGILFFAGPTGVGKTELAKALAELLFGDERAYVRFDMSEFSAEHSDARLIGAPPGYVGYGSGGELTNAVRQRPFSLILFDEVEKAHERILDKFLQVLEDGRLTDGSGTTVHFSESVLVFTSNLGIYVEDELGHRVPNVSPGAPYEEVAGRVRAAIVEHFTLRLNRPELLNRLGDNIVVFDFIDASTASSILDLLVDSVRSRVWDEHKVELQLLDEARAQLLELVTREEVLALGGRGIGNMVETALVNPLARKLFDDPTVMDDGKVLVEAIHAQGGNYSLAAT